MSLRSLVSPGRRRSDRRSTLLASSAFRMQVRPPSLRQVPSSWWQRTLFWLTAPAPLEAAPPLNRLPGVRQAFLEALHDLDTEAAAGVRQRIGTARSLRDLWHLRAEVYSAVGVACSQAEAERRVTHLDSHFPARASRAAATPAA